VFLDSEGYYFGVSYVFTLWFIIATEFLNFSDIMLNVSFLVLTSA